LFIHQLNYCEIILLFEIYKMSLRGLYEDLEEHEFKTGDYDYLHLDHLTPIQICACVLAKFLSDECETSVIHIHKFVQWTEIICMLLLDNSQHMTYSYMKSFLVENCDIFDDDFFKRFDKEVRSLCLNGYPYFHSFLFSLKFEIKTIFPYDPQRRGSVMATFLNRVHVFAFECSTAEMTGIWRNFCNFVGLPFNNSKKSADPLQEISIKANEEVAVRDLDCSNYSCSLSEVESTIKNQITNLRLEVSDAPPFEQVEKWIKKVIEEHHNVFAIKLFHAYNLMRVRDGEGVLENIHCYFSRFPIRRCSPYYKCKRTPNDDRHNLPLPMPQLLLIKMLSRMKLYDLAKRYWKGCIRNAVCQNDNYAILMCMFYMLEMDVSEKVKEDALFSMYYITNKLIPHRFALLEYGLWRYNMIKRITETNQLQRHSPKDTTKGPSGNPTLKTSPFDDKAYIFMDDGAVVSSFFTSRGYFRIATSFCLKRLFNSTVPLKFADKIPNLNRMECYCVLLCNFIYSSFCQGDLKLALSMIEYMKINYKNGEQLASKWRMCEIFCNFEIAFYKRDVDLCENLVEKCRVFSQTEAQIKQIRVFAMRKEYEKAFAVFQQLESKRTENPFYFLRLLIEMIDMALKFEHPLNMVRVMKQFYLLVQDHLEVAYLDSMLKRRIAACLYKIGNSKNAIAVADQALTMLKHHRYAFEEALCLGLLARCHYDLANRCTTFKKRNDEINRAITFMSSALDIFEKFEVPYYHRKYALLFLAALYHNLGNKTLRDHASEKYLRLHEQFPDQYDFWDLF
ncbi:Anaphase-promoting complex subunit 5, partial [Trichinella pseudospiralis]